MSDASQVPRRGVLARLYTALDTARRFAVNLLFLAIVVVLVAVWVAPGGTAVQPKTTLVLNLSGNLVEQYTGTSRLMAITRQFDEEDPEMQLRDVVNVIDAAAKDANIVRMLLMTDDLSGGGLASLREVAAAMKRFQAAGKEIVAWGTHLDQRRYYLAAHANQSFLHPMGIVMLEGFGRHRNYYRDALDKLGIAANVVRAGRFKNGGETYAAAEPSKETLEADKLLYDGLWKTYVTEVEAARKLPQGAVMKTIDQFDTLLAEHGGDAAKLAHKAGWISGLKTRDELRQMLMDKGEKDEVNKTFRQVSFHNYLATVQPKLAGDAVAVVVAEGEIVDGNAPAGRVGGRSTAELIRRARNDDRFKAIVLRVNSPGGSAIGSELVRRELEVARSQGKPVVVSMGDVAASGGYWVSMGADEVIADPATISGSIGVYALLPTASKAMEKLSIGTGGYTTTWLREQGYDPRRPLHPRFLNMVQAGIDRIYADFKTRAAAARKTTPEAIDAVAQGRVWSGQQAKERALIDGLGQFADAVKAARSRAKLPEDSAVVYIEPEKSRIERFLEAFGAAGVRVALSMADRHWLTGVPVQSAREVRSDLTWLSEVVERAAQSGMPYAALAHCLCKGAL
jgi:protease-4